MTRTAQILALLTFTVVLAGCKKPERVGEVVLGDDGAMPVSFEIVGAGARADVPAPLTTTVTQASMWDTLRPRLTFTRPPAPVDFAGAMLVVVAPAVPSSGHSVRVEAIEEDADGLHVSYVVYAPAADCLTEGRPQTPFQVVRLRRIDGPVRFTARAEPLKCTFDW